MLFKRTVSVYNYNGTYLAPIYPNEIYTWINDHSAGFDAMYRNVKFYRAATGKYQTGYVSCHANMPGQYTQDHNYGVEYQNNKWVKLTTPTGQTVSGFRMNARSACRVFSGTSMITRVYSGDYVLADHGSVAGESYPYRLKINGYVKNGTAYYIGDNGWCDTDVEIGNCTRSTSCIYA